MQIICDIHDIHGCNIGYIIYEIFIETIPGFVVLFFP